MEGFLGLKESQFCSPSSFPKRNGTGLVVQGLRIHLVMQGTPVLSLVWEDPTWRGAIKPVDHNYWSLCAPKAHAPQQEKPPQWEAWALQQRPSAAKNNLIFLRNGTEIEKERRLLHRAELMSWHQLHLPYLYGIGTVGPELPPPWKGLGARKPSLKFEMRTRFLPGDDSDSAKL